MTGHQVNLAASVGRIETNVTATPVQCGSSVSSRGHWQDTSKVAAKSAEQGASAMTGSRASIHGRQFRGATPYRLRRASLVLRVLNAGFLLAFASLLAVRLPVHAQTDVSIPARTDAAGAHSKATLSEEAAILPLLGLVAEAQGIPLPNPLEVFMEGREDSLSPVPISLRQVDTVSPVFVSASTDGEYVTITFSEEIFVSPLVRYVQEWSGAPLHLFLKAAFDVSINGDEIFQHDGVSLSGTDLTLQLAYYAGTGDDVRVAYNNIFARNAGGLLVDAAGNTVPYFSYQTVQNNATGGGSNLVDGAVLTPSAITIPEGRSGTYTVALASRPSENVSVKILPYAIVQVTPTQLTFTPDDWDDPQTVTVSTFDDNDSVDA